MFLGDTQSVSQPIGLTSPSFFRIRSDIFPPAFAVAIVSQAKQCDRYNKHRDIPEVAYKTTDNERHSHNYRNHVYIANDKEIQLFQHFTPPYSWAIQAQNPVV